MFFTAAPGCFVLCIHFKAYQVSLAFEMVFRIISFS